MNHPAHEGQNINFGNMHPKSFDPKIKNQIINQNIYHSGYGNYKMCPMFGSIRFPYKNDYNPGPITSICKVIVHNKHSLDVADALSDHSLNSLSSTKPIPAIMYPMGKDFVGVNLEAREGVYDENIILRTNYPFIIKRQPELFNKKEAQKYIIYSNPITIIRDYNYNPLGYDNLFKVSVITICYERQKDLLVEEGKIHEGERKKRESDIKTLTSTDLLNFQMYVENVFQAALCGHHEVLLLTVFGREFGVPVDDQIIIYNLCVMKYGHMFKSIMFCIPPYEGKDLFDYFDREIIKPQQLVKDIDMKYQAEVMAEVITKGAAVSPGGEKRAEGQLPLARSKITLTNKHESGESESPYARFSSGKTAAPGIVRESFDIKMKVQKKGKNKNKDGIVKNKSKRRSKK